MSALPIAYDPLLVVLSIVVAIIGVLTGFVMTLGIHRQALGMSRLAFFKGAAIIGGSIWSMHFIAMLAVDLPVAIDYNIIWTVSSFYIAVFFTAIGLFLAGKRRIGKASLPVAAIFMGCGVASMHYLGMSGIRGCGISYDAKYVSASIVVAIVASGLSLWFIFRKRGVLETFIGGLILGLAIPAMHYIGMMGTAFFSSTTILTPITPVFSKAVLAYIIAGATLGICGLYLYLFGSLLIEDEAEKMPLSP